MKNFIFSTILEPISLQLEPSCTVNYIQPTLNQNHSEQKRVTSTKRNKTYFSFKNSKIENKTNTFCGSTWHTNIHKIHLKKKKNSLWLFLYKQAVNLKYLTSNHLLLNITPNTMMGHNSWSLAHAQTIAALIHTQRKWSAFDYLIKLKKPNS